MTERISLALVLHNHQPVGNFGWVVAQAYSQAYLPMIGALEEHPTIRMGLHYSGGLLDWLTANEPEFLERLAALAARDQVELLGGGYYEPILPALPARDRLGQLVRMADEIERLAGRRPGGAWLAERVWEPSLPSDLVEAGYDWTILDDAHFRAASIVEDALWGAYVTEDQGRLLHVFGTEQGLRYRIPFGEVDEVISYLRDHATPDGRRLGTMGDDGEKFGSWPTTYAHCWGERHWVERFLAALEANSDWLTLVTPTEWLSREAPIGRVYIPTGSYAEMGEWALPADEGRVFAELLHAAVAEGRPEARWLRGGFWRNFAVRYREVNDLHKQMLTVSDRVDQMADGAARRVALDHLYRGQANDAYWHGLFGGIYLSHLRSSTHAAIIAAEDLADREAHAGGRLIDGTDRVDADLDGRPEIVVRSPGQVLVVAPDRGGAISRWDIRAARHALCAVMTRRPEAYHARLVEHETLGSGGPRAGSGATPVSTSPGATVAGAAASIARPSGESGAIASAGSGAIPSAKAGPRSLPGALPSAESGPTTIHALVRAKEPGLASRLVYDDYERRSGLVWLVAPGASAVAFAAGRVHDLGGARDGPFRILEVSDKRITLRFDGRLRATEGEGEFSITKILSFDGDRRAPRLTVELILRGLGPGGLAVDAVLESNHTLLGGGGNRQAFYERGGVRMSHDSTTEMEFTERLVSGNDWLGLTIETMFEPPARVGWYPIETISNSEEGFERAYQGSCQLAAWAVDLGSGKEHVVRQSHRLRTERDLTALEGF